MPQFSPRPALLHTPPSNLRLQSGLHIVQAIVAIGVTLPPMGLWISPSSLLEDNGDVAWVQSEMFERPDDARAGIPSIINANGDQSDCPVVLANFRSEARHHLSKLSKNGAGIVFSIFLGHVISFVISACLHPCRQKM